MYCRNNELSKQILDVFIVTKRFNVQVTCYMYTGV